MKHLDQEDSVGQAHGNDAKEREHPVSRSDEAPHLASIPAPECKRLPGDVFPHRLGPNSGETEVRPPRGGEEAAIETTRDVPFAGPEAEDLASGSGSGSKHLAQAGRKPCGSHQRDIRAAADAAVESPSVDDQADRPGRLKTLVDSEDAVDDPSCPGPGGDHVVPHHSGIEDAELLLANSNRGRGVEGLGAVGVIPLQVLWVPP